MPVTTGEPRLFRSAKAILGESLVWDPEGDLLWCDITAGLLHRSPLDGSVFGADDGTSALPAPVASFAPTVDGGFVVSLGDRVILTDIRGVETAELARIEHARPGLRLNEGKADPAGRWVTGSMNLTAEDPAEPGSAIGALYSIEEDETGAVTQRVLRGGFGVANGFEWSEDGRTIYFTDTSVKTIYRGQYSSAGEIGEVEVFHAGEDHDGLAMDVEGYLWSGIYGAGKVVRYSPDGDEDLSIDLPSPNITSVAFGGPGLGTLFVTSARENLTEQQLRQNPLAGSIFAIDTSTQGYPVRRFGHPTRETAE
ncbi:MAG: SMP-30/gluconolactonase/LRE family protein [Glaciihabitans sp.]|nr:SMP-30/gluconolactonase/LRE family protein [Glaciihabitans sp.]